MQSTFKVSTQHPAGSHAKRYQVVYSCNLPMLKDDEVLLFSSF